MNTELRDAVVRYIAESKAAGIRLRAIAERARRRRFALVRYRLRAIASDRIPDALWDRPRRDPPGGARYRVQHVDRRRFRFQIF